MKNTEDYLLNAENYRGWVIFSYEYFKEKFSIK